MIDERLDGSRWLTFTAFTDMLYVYTMLRITSRSLKYNFLLSRHLYHAHVFTQTLLRRHLEFSQCSCCPRAQIVTASAGSLAPLSLLPQIHMHHPLSQAIRTSNTRNIHLIALPLHSSVCQFQPINSTSAASTFCPSNSYSTLLEQLFKTTTAIMSLKNGTSQWHSLSSTALCPYRIA
jgi:hypothetical protein